MKGNQHGKEKTSSSEISPRALFMTDIHTTEFFPAIVKHQFTDSGIAALNNDGEINYWI